MDKQWQDIHFKHATNKKKEELVCRCVHVLYINFRSDDIIIKYIDKNKTEGFMIIPKLRHYHLIID